MLNDKDKKYLSGVSKPIYLFSMATLISVALIFVAASFRNLYLAKIIGSAEGYRIADVAANWAHGIELKESYSGAYVMAINRFEMAFLDIGVVVILGISVWATYASRRRNIRIVRALKNCGAWKGDGHDV